MEPLLDLPIDQFFGALDELGLDPERRDDLMREYRRRNSAFSPVYGLLDSVADEDAAAGMQRADIVPISRPEGMSVAEAIRSGDWRLAVPQGALDAVGNVAGALDVPAAAAAGLIPREDMVGEALNAAGAIMGLGGLLARPAGSLGTGGRVASRSGDETPAQQVARLLREGRSDEVTDDLMAQTDPQEMYQLYVSGQTGMDLPMDQLSRELRAEEMGFMERPETYHGTSDDFQAFRTSFRPDGEGGSVNVGVYSADFPRVAESYASPVIGGNIIPLATRPTHYDVTVQGRGANWNTITEGAPTTTGAAEPSRPLADVFPGAFDNVSDPFATRTNAIAREANRDGAGSVVFDGITDIGPHGDTTGMTRYPPSRIQTDFYPHNIRSRFARFDPRLSHLANLNAANIDPLTGAAAMGASQQQQDPLASLRAYLAQNGLLSQ